MTAMWRVHCIVLASAACHVRRLIFCCRYVQWWLKRRWRRSKTIPRRASCLGSISIALWLQSSRRLPKKKRKRMKNMEKHCKAEYANLFNLGWDMQSMKSGGANSCIQQVVRMKEKRTESIVDRFKTIHRWWAGQVGPHFAKPHFRPRTVFDLECL